MSDSLATPYTPAEPTSHGSPAPGWLRLSAIVAGLVGFVLFIATPLLPVNQVQSSFSWPSDDSLNSVNAPLISLAPEQLEADIPVSAIDQLREGQTQLFGTLPASSKEATDRGLFVNAGDFGLSVSSLNEVVLSLTPDQMERLDDKDVIHISSTEDETTVEVGPFSQSIDDDDLRPQITGAYSEIEDTPENLAQLRADGLDVQVEINSRFTSSPTLLKSLAMWGGLAMVLVSLFTLWRIDRLDGKRPGFMPESWKKIRPLDGVVAAVLIFWHIFGANTSDDGFILTMGRVSENADYMANYYRWYGVPESPFGSPYYDLVAFLSQISATSVFMRLPALVSAFLIWFILSRELLPRFGELIDSRRVAHWTAALMFLAFWLPYNNGVRPEPVIALGVIFTWASFERAIATRRLLPAAVGTIAATLTLGAGPTGLFAVGVFLVCLPQLFKIMRERLPLLGGGATGWLSMIAPFLASGTAIFVAVFGDQTLAAVMESIRVRSEVGPALPWYSEYVRYSTLFQQSVDGSMTRRFAMFTMLFCLVLIIYAYIKDHRVAGAPQDITQRLLLIVAMSMFFLLFTPTKWTHHFGIYAGVAGVIAALGAVVLSQIALKSPRARTFSLAAVVILLAFSTAGWNAWWYVSSFGVPWWDRTIQFRAIEANTVLLAIGLILVGIGIWQSFRHNSRKAKSEAAGATDEFERQEAARVSRWAGVMSAPIALACAFMVGISVASFAKAYVDQYPAYSVGKGNTQALAGKTCSLSDEAMIETNTNDAFLAPMDGDLGNSLADPDKDNYGFDPNGIPEDIEPEAQNSASVGAIGDSGSAGSATSGGNRSAGGDVSDSDATGSDDSEDSSHKDSASKAAEESGASEGGSRDTTGVNGSVKHLPFNFDYNQVPVLGSYNEGQNSTAKLTTKWFNLPEEKKNSPLITVGVAGKIHHHDVNGVEQEGMDVTLEYGTADETGRVSNTGEIEMMDVGATPKWRNLRYPLADIPDEANVVRIVAVDDSTNEDDWVAVTPPRVPELTSMTSRFDSSRPALLDWSTALQFPCQRTFDHYAGVTEIPEFRILPDAPAQTSLTDFQSFSGGGAMSTSEALNYSYEIPSYLNNDWNRDWGSIYKYELRTNSVGIAPDKANINLEDITRSGWWKNSEMNVRPEGEE